MKQYIVFDMDGVLFDSEQLISRCWKEVGAKMGLPHIYETFLDCVGTTQKNTQAVFQRTYPGVSYDQFQKGCRAGFFGHVDAHGMPLKPGARELLHHLREANWASAWPAPPDGCWCRASWKGLACGITLIKWSPATSWSGANPPRTFT